MRKVGNNLVDLVGWLFFGGGGGVFFVRFCFVFSLSLNLAGQFSQAAFHTEMAVVQLSKPSFCKLDPSFRKAACQTQTGETHLVSS